MTAATAPALDVTKVSRVLETILYRDSRPVMLRSMASWQLHRIPAHVAAAPAGLLPAFLVAGDALLREGTGEGIETSFRPAGVSLLGCQVDAVRHSRFTDVMLAMMEAVDQIGRGGRLMADDLKLVIELSRARLEEMVGPGFPDVRPVYEPTLRPGPSP